MTVRMQIFFLFIYQEQFHYETILSQIDNTETRLLLLISFLVKEQLQLLQTCLLACMYFWYSYSYPDSYEVTTIANT